MSAAQDAQITQELEALVAAKDKQQRLMRNLFILAAADTAFAVVMATRHHAAIALLFAALAILSLVFGVRAHLRAAALRGQALETILAEAFRRAGKEPPAGEP